MTGMKSAPKKISGGRPTREAAQLLADKIIDVATQLMLEHGYSNTSIEAVASAAGVAKRTLYSRFPEKRDLFAAVVGRRREKMLAPITKIAEAPGKVEDKLEQIGNHILMWGQKKDTIAMRRLIAAEVGRFPELSIATHNNSRAQIVELLSGVLQQGVAEGVVAVDDLYFAALQFQQMILMPADLHTHYGLKVRGGSNRSEYVKRVVDLFLHGCRVSVRA
jgi:TetR/AcrR family transcriptional regulator, mexJK operon transcriptional repressor